MAGTGNIWVEKSLITSNAFAAITSPTAFRVLMIFFCKRQCERSGRGGRARWEIANNGEIEFTGPEATKKYGIPESTFGRAIDELRDKGFIDIAESGAGLYKSKNLYAISDRWRDYGTPQYRPPKPRPKGPMNRGFKKGNHHGRNCKKIETTVTDNIGSDVVDYIG